MNKREKTLVKCSILTVFCILNILILTSCQTAPKRYSEFGRGSWKAKVLIKDKAKSKSHIVNLDINAIKDSKMRLDVTLPSGFHLASLTLVGDEVEYVLPRQKKFFRGKASADSLMPLLNISLEPAILYNVVFDTPIEREGWNCTNRSGVLKECVNLKAKTKIRWDDKSPTIKFIKIDHSKAELQLRFVSFSPRLRQSKNLFSLKPPKGFSILKLQ